MHNDAGKQKGKKKGFPTKSHDRKEGIQLKHKNWRQRDHKTNLFSYPAKQAFTDYMYDLD